MSISKEMWARFLKEKMGYPYSLARIRRDITGLSDSEIWNIYIENKSYYKNKALQTMLYACVRTMRDIARLL